MKMLKFLAQKLRSQSLNEVQPFQPKVDDERDSGTESDDENVELEELASLSQMESDSQPPSTTSSTSDDSLFHSINLFESQDLADIDTNANTDHNFERQKQTPSSLSELSDFEQASSEEELTVIERDLHKRKWSQVSVRGCSDNAGSSDEEVRDLFAPQPLSFSSSPPRSIQRLSRSPPPKLFLANVAPAVQMISASSPRKRHCRTSPIHSQEAKSVMPRPCLDFEKMQQKIFRRHFGHTHGLNRARIVKIRSLNGGNLRQPKCFYDPSVFSFRSISAAYNPMTPVEEPSCAY